MAFNNNLVEITGNLVEDLKEIETKNKDVMIYSFVLAVNRQGSSYYDKTEDKVKERVDYIDFQTLTPISQIQKSTFTMSKGVAVNVIGRLQKDVYDDKKGNKVYNTYVKPLVINKMDYSKNGVTSKLEQLRNTPSGSLTE